MKKCTKCKKTKNLDQFHIDNKSVTRRFGECIVCCNQIGTKEKRFGRIFSNAKNGAKRRGKIKGRIDNSSIFTITKRDIEDMDRIQNNRCALSGMLLYIKSGDFTYSLDRIDPSKGYTRENCRWIIMELNGRITWTEEKIRYMLSQLQLPSCDELPDDTRVLLTIIKELLRTADYHTVRRNKNPKRVKTECTVTVEDLLVQYKNQYGRCAYSNMKIGLKRGEAWYISLERINNNLGYTYDNICFVCLEFNVSDRTATAVTEDFIKGWSRDKFNHVHESFRRKYHKTEEYSYE